MFHNQNYSLTSHLLSVVAFLHHTCFYFFILYLYSLILSSLSNTRHIGKFKSIGEFQVTFFTDQFTDEFAKNLSKIWKNTEMFLLKKSGFIFCLETLLKQIGSENTCTNLKWKHWKHWTFWSSSACFGK